MTDLTDKWKKGELSIGWYYIKLWKGCIVIDHFIMSDQFLRYDNSDIVEIVAPVPSYDEWKDLKSKLQLKETTYDFDTARLEAENLQLKELLKECFEYIDWTDGTGSPINQQKLLDKINEVLK